MAKFKQVPQSFMFRKLVKYCRNMVKNFDSDCRDNDFFDVVRNCFDHDGAGGDVEGEVPQLQARPLRPSGRGVLRALEHPRQPRQVPGRARGCLREHGVRLLGRLARHDSAQGRRAQARHEAERPRDGNPRLRVRPRPDVLRVAGPHRGPREAPPLRDGARPLVRGSRQGALARRRDTEVQPPRQRLRLQPPHARRIPRRHDGRDHREALLHEDRLRRRPSVGLLRRALEGRRGGPQAHARRQGRQVQHPPLRDELRAEPREGARAHGVRGEAGRRGREEHEGRGAHGRHQGVQHPGGRVRQHDDCRRGGRAAARELLRLQPLRLRLRRREVHREGRDGSSRRSGFPTPPPRRWTSPCAAASTTPSASSA